MRCQLVVAALTVVLWLALLVALLRRVSSIVACPTAQAFAVLLLLARLAVLPSSVGVFQGYVHVHEHVRKDVHVERRFDMS